jgi:hypothetical protein
MFKINFLVPVQGIMKIFLHFILSGMTLTQQKYTKCTNVHRLERAGFEVL